MKRRFVFITLFLLLILSCSNKDVEKFKKAFNFSNSSGDKELCDFARSEWNRIKREKNQLQAKQWEIYLKKYPQGICSHEARERIKQADENFKRNLKLLEAMKPLWKEGDKVGR